MNSVIKKGSRRIVFLIGRRVFKIPNIFNWVSFIRGIEENLEERYWWSADGSRKRNPKQKWNYNIPLAEIYWADRFGFLLIMERLNTDFQIDNKFRNDFSELKELTKHYSFYPDVDIRNVGYRGNRLLVLDYGFFGGTRDCYIGT